MLSSFYTVVVECSLQFSLVPWTINRIEVARQLLSPQSGIWARTPPIIVLSISHTSWNSRNQHAACRCCSYFWAWANKSSLLLLLPLQFALLKLIHSCHCLLLSTLLHKGVNSNVKATFVNVSTPPLMRFMRHRLIDEFFIYLLQTLFSF